MVISDGAGVAFPFFIASQAAAGPDRLPGGLRPDLASDADRQAVLPALVAVPLQWPEQAASYPRGKVIGCLL